MSTEKNPLDSYIVEDTNLSSEVFGEYEYEVEEPESIFTEEQVDEQNDDEVEEQAEEQVEEVIGETPDIPFAEFAKSWKSAGLLTEDFKLPEKNDINSFKDAIFDNIYTPLKEAAQSQAEEELESARKEKGLHVIEIAEKIAKGVSVTTASDGEIIDRLISLDTDSDTDEAYENREKLIRTMHQLNGIPEKKIEKLIQMSQDDGDDIEDAKEAKEYLKKLKVSKEQEEMELAKKREDEYKAGVDNYQNMIKSIIDKGEINEGVNKESFYKDLTELTVYVDVNNGEKNIKRKFTKFQKAQMDAGVVITPTVDAVNKKDVKRYLELAHQLMYGAATKEKIKEKVKKELEDDLDNFLTKRKPSKPNQSDFFEVKIS